MDRAIWWEEKELTRVDTGGGRQEEHELRVGEGGRDITNTEKEIYTPPWLWLKARNLY